MDHLKYDLKSLMEGQAFDDSLPQYKNLIYPKDKIGFNRSIGPYFYFILDWQTGKYPFISNGWKEFLDYPEDFWQEGIEGVFRKIHEDDREAVRAIAYKSHQFSKGKTEQEINKYAISHDFRVRKNNGEVINILQQSIYISLDKKGNIIYDSGMITDISHLKNNGNVSLRIIGPDNTKILEYYPKYEQNTNGKNGRLNEKLNHLQMLKTRHAFIDNIHKVIIENVHNPEFSVSSLCQFMNISRSHLHRKMKTLANISPNYLLKIIRLQKALKLMTENHYNLSEIAYRVGFSSPTYFSKCFAEEIGYSPTDYKAKLISENFF